MTLRNKDGTAVLSTAEQARNFMLAGCATVTLRSAATQTRFTYKIVRSKEHEDTWYVRVLYGQDNTSDFRYLGIISGLRREFRITQRSHYKVTSPCFRAFSWTWERLLRNHAPVNVEIWHEGRCGRCGRVLTVPESILSGYGPECAGLIQGL